MTEITRINFDDIKFTPIPELIEKFKNIENFNVVILVNTVDRVSGLPVQKIFVRPVNVEFDFQNRFFWNFVSIGFLRLIIGADLPSTIDWSINNFELWVDELEQELQNNP